MRDSPDMLSMGLRCMEHGYQFHWPANSDLPCFMKPDGSTIHMTVENYIPFLDVDATPAAPFMHSKPTVKHDHVVNEPARPTGNVSFPLNPDSVSRACDKGDSCGGPTATPACHANAAGDNVSSCGSSPATPAADVEGDGGSEERHLRKDSTEKTLRAMKDSYRIPVVT